MKLYGFWRSLATFRVRIALNLKGLPYQETMVDLLKGEQFGTGYQAVNPQGVLPALLDGDGAPLFQSMAILEYLDETHLQPPLLPPAPGAPRRRGPPPFRVEGIPARPARAASPAAAPAAGAARPRARARPCADRR